MANTLEAAPKSSQLRWCPSLKWKESRVQMYRKANGSLCVGLGSTNGRVTTASFQSKVFFTALRSPLRGGMQKLLPFRRVTEPNPPPACRAAYMAPHQGHPAGQHCTLPCRLHHPRGHFIIFYLSSWRIIGCLCAPSIGFFFEKKRRAGSDFLLTLSHHIKSLLLLPSSHTHTTELYRLVLSLNGKSLQSALFRCDKWQKEWLYPNWRDVGFTSSGSRRVCR